jgi:hypothetical protein
MLSNAPANQSRKSSQRSSGVGVGRGEGVDEGLVGLVPEPDPEWSPLDESFGGSGDSEGLGEALCSGWCVEVAPGTPRCAFGGWLGSVLGVAAGCPTDSIVVVARSVHTTGFGLPVAAVALSASRAAAAAARANGARCNVRTPGVADR